MSHHHLSPHESQRLIADAEKRATALELAKHEMDILYEASNRLVQATTPAELLEAVSTYPREIGAVNATLGYFDDWQPQWMEVVAVWAAAPLHSATIGTRVDLSKRSLPMQSIARPERPLLVENLFEADFVGEESLQLARHRQLHSMALLPLHFNGRWVGTLTFSWKEVHRFDERDERIFTALHQQLSSVAAYKRLLQETQARATELENARYEMDILYESSNKLVKAATLSEQLEAISDYARSNGATRGLLVYIEFDGDERIDEIVAEWTIGDTEPIGIGTQLRYPADAFANSPQPSPQRPAFFRDVTHDKRLWSGTREFNRRYNMMANVVLPLFHKGRRVAGINFIWDYPRDFDERDERIYSVLQQQIAAVVDSMRLFERLQKRAVELESANQELNILYKTSEAINSANTYAEVVEAVAQFDPEADVVTLMLWNTWDWKTADYLEVPVVIDRTGQGKLPVGSRLPKEHFPIAKHMMGQRVWMFEDAETDPRVDPVTAANWAALDIRSFMGPALYIKKKWLGGITFHSSKPRKYSEREERLLAGIGDIVLAAIQRIRLQHETEVSRQRAEELASTNAELLRQTQQRAQELEGARREAERYARNAQKLASLEERTRLARELHDSVSQVLYGIGLGARTARAVARMNPDKLDEPLDYILSLAEAGLTEMRALIFELRPESLEQEGLITTLNKQALSLQARYGIQVETVFCSEPDLPLDVKESLYRIAREALHNTVKHAQATSVRLSMTHLNEGYRLEVEDNGLGFDIHQEFAGHLGLKSMRERTNSLGGLLEITSAVGAGTKISITLAGGQA